MIEKQKERERAMDKKRLKGKEKRCERSYRTRALDVA